MMTKTLLKVFVIAILLIMVFFVGTGFTLEPYPTKPITIVHGWGAGGGSDLATRAISRAAEKELGQPIINENRPGAGGVIAKAYVCNSKPDGYVLGTTAISTFVIQPQLRKTPYDPFKDITDIMAYALYPFGLSVRADAPWNSLEEVIEYARKNPGKFTYASAGAGTSHHICLERIAMKEGVKLTMVPFKSGPEAVTAVLGGHTDGTTQGTSDVVPQIQAGKMKVLLSFSNKRWAEVPQVPCILEKGYNFYVLSHQSLYGPKGIPEYIREKLETAFKNAMKNPSFKDAMRQLYLEEVYLSGKEFSDLWKSQYAELGKVLNALGLVEK